MRLRGAYVFVEVYRRVGTAAGFFTLAVVAGTLGYYMLGDGLWGVEECLYMTVVTISTVGFGEMLPHMDAVPGARLLTIGLIVLGSGTLLYFASALTALIVEGDLRDVIRRAAMQRRIEAMEDHIIVCGCGSTGRHVIEELVGAGESFVVIDAREEAIAQVADDLGRGIDYIIGEATDDHTLERAGIARAKGVIAALTTDQDNLFVTITAKGMNQAVRIVAKAIAATTEPKLRRAGADGIVSPNQIGGNHLANEMLRPTTVAFFDRIMRDRSGHRLSIEEIRVPEESLAVGQPLAMTRIRDLGALVIAVHLPDGGYVYNPSADQMLDVGTGLVVLARPDAVHAIRSGLSDGGILAQG